MERSLRHQVDTTGTTMPGWAKQPPDRPTVCRRVTKCSGLRVVKVDQPRHLARALSSVQPQYLTALRVQATCVTIPTRGGGNLGVVATHLA